MLQKKAKKRFITQINVKSRKNSIRKNSKLLGKNRRSYFVRGISKKSTTKKIDSAQKEKFIKTAALITGILFFLIIFSSLLTLRYLSTVTKDLPSPDDPFKGKSEASIIYASNIDSESEQNEILYRIYNEEDRDLLKISDVPEHVKWSVIAAEDIDFYEHPGIDFKSILKAVEYEIFGIGEQRGASTITQQLIKQTTLGTDRTFTRKLKEIVLALHVEQKYSKDEILEMYLNVNNYGSNIYGLKRASEFYFDKDISELTLSESAILARIPQSPLYNSPTLSPDPEQAKILSVKGREYVLNQMQKNLEKINNHIINDDLIILDKEIEAARIEPMDFKSPIIDIKAPHFVFYIQSLLSSDNYNNGKPFTQQEMQTGGYRIYTSLDMNVQRIAEDEVLNNGVNRYSMPRGGHNGAVLITRPSTGDIVSMVGSKSYSSQSEGKYFDGQVNITASLQSMGSSMKPAAYYKAFEMGISSPGSYLPDVPIKIGSYTPRNWDGGFKGTKSGATPRMQLRESRNIPAVMLVDSMGITAYTDVLSKFGYRSIEKNPQNYGPSLVLGGGDVTMLEHAQGYGVFANGGNLVKINPILKITKHNPKTGEEELVYTREIKPELVADPKSVYLVNHILNYKNAGPGNYIDGRDHAGKTGTTELHKDTIYVGYTPDMVVVGWNGNNDNTPMIYGSWGENVTKPWVVNLTKRTTAFFPEKSPFMRPGGLISYKGDLIIEGKYPSQTYFYKYVSKSSTKTQAQNSL